jgi:hypothetical protein
MARVEWTRQSGDDVEAVVSMMLCSRFPNAIRVRPSQGDHGIDVFIPGPAGFGAERAVYQVKKYYENLTASQKRKIKASYKKVVDASAEKGWRITEWHLVMPLDLTTQNLGWLDEIVKDADFPCEPHGLTFCDTLAAHYPKVIDYYLNDGKQRLQDAIDNLVQLLSGRQDRVVNQGLVPADVLGDLVAIYRALNDCDPFYRYEYGVADSPPSDAPSPDEPGLVAISAREHDSVWIIIKIFALSSASLKERPIGGQFQLNVPEGDDELAKQVQKFVDYGAPLSMPEGTVSGSLDLPAGLGRDFTGGSLQMLSVINRVDENEDPTELTIAMLEPDSDVVIASTTIKRTETSSGQGGGFRSVWTDKADLFTLEMLTDGSRQATVNVTVSYNLSGRRPADIVDSLEFLAAMHAPNRIGFCLTYGPPEYMLAGTAPDRSSAVAERWALVSGALMGIQGHVSQLLRMPAAMSGDQSVQIIEAAKLMSGQARTGPLTGLFTVYHHQAEELLGPDREPVPTIDREPDVVYEFVAIKAIKITLGDETIIVGKEALFVRGRYLEIGDDASRIEPVTDGVSIHYTGQVDVGRVLARHLPSMATADLQTPTADTDQTPTTEAGQPN